MTNERKIKNEEIKALAEKYSLAASDIEKGIEELEAEDIFLSADYIEDMIINGDLLPLTITLNLEKATYSDTDASKNTFATLATAPRLHKPIGTKPTNLPWKRYRNAAFSLPTRMRTRLGFTSTSTPTWI